MDEKPDKLALWKNVAAVVTTIISIAVLIECLKVINPIP